MTAAELAQAQLDAYNARDIEAFLACYCDDVKIYNYPDELVLQGQEAMRTRYSARFADPDLYAHVVNRIVQDDCAIDHEVIRVNLPGGLGVMHAIAIYRVQHGKIAEVRFIQGAKEVGASLPPGCGPSAK